MRPKFEPSRFASESESDTATKLANWLLTAPDANPAMLQIFRDRDKKPPRDLVPWAGEFAGKYLISGVQSLRLTKDKRLRARLESFVAELIATQSQDGYLGPFPSAEKMTGPAKMPMKPKA